MNDLITVKDTSLKPTPHQKTEDGNKIFAAFRSYDIRGIYPDELDSELAYKTAKAFLALSPGEKYVIARDMRHSSVILEKAIIQAIQEEGKEVDSIGLTTTDHLYFTVGNYKYDGGIMITASHNSAIFNGIKYVKKGVGVVAMDDLKEEFDKISGDIHYLPLDDVRPNAHPDYKAEFITHIKSFQTESALREMKIVVDYGNGMASSIAQDYFASLPQLEVVGLNSEPNADFPNHEANPAIATNMIQLQEAMRKEKAELGVAFDGDGDRVFFVDENAEIIPGYYIAALLAEYYLRKNKGETVIYDTRYTRALEDVVAATGGRGEVSKAGHTFVKIKMKQEDAIFGCETTSSHFYYRKNFYADSGMVTLSVILNLLTITGAPIGQMVKAYRDRYFISGEQNFFVKDKEKYMPKIIDQLKTEYPQGSRSEFDGVIIEFPEWRFSLRPSGTEPFIRLNIEANSPELLEERKASLFNVIQEFAQHTGNVSNLYGLTTLNFTPKEKLEELFGNMNFTWNQFKSNYLDDLYKDTWARNQTPLDVLNQIDPPDLEAFYAKNKINIEESLRLYKTYMTNRTWFDKISIQDEVLRKLEQEPIAYFSLEFGLADWLQIYSGGLGILAGDTLKEASDSGLPMVGIGLFYSEGFFHQRLDENDWQMEDYLSQDFDDYPIELIRDSEGRTVIVDVKMLDRVVKVRGWRLKVGRRSLILLDTNFSGNPNWDDRMISFHLYGGNEETRIKQEIILGIGGYQFLRAIGISPSILHLNEGHSAFVVIAKAAEIIAGNNTVTFEEAIKKAKNNILFTNHTLKQAGNDVFPYELVEEHLSAYTVDLRADFRQIFSLGVDPLYADGRFGMTILGFRNAEKVSAVSKLHAEAAKDIWPDYSLIPVTNGVHMPTWVAESIHELLDKYVSERWTEQGANIDWKDIYKIPDSELWDAHISAKRLLLKHIKANCGVEMSDNGIIISWFRRMTSYKQPEVLTLDMDKLDQLLNHSGTDVRMLFGGKAHPKDVVSKEVLQQIIRISKDPKFKEKLVFVPDYNWRMAKYMVSGSDVWLNTPIRLQEACGTSGMKAAANGLMQFSTLDGWIDEIKDTGVVFPIDDNLNPDQFYSQINDGLLTLFNNRDEGDLPKEWIKRMKQTMIIALSEYGTDRMLRGYIEQLYRPMLKEKPQI